VSTLKNAALEPLPTRFWRLCGQSYLRGRRLSNRGAVMCPKPPFLCVRTLWRRKLARRPWLGQRSMTTVGCKSVPDPPAGRENWLDWPT